MAVIYGYCCLCGAPVRIRTRGIPSMDRCENGHETSADRTLSKDPRDLILSSHEGLENQLFSALLPLVREQSAGEWLETAIQADAAMLAKGITPIVERIIENGGPLATH